MPEFRYARGRIVDSIRYLSEEMKEFQDDYADRSWQDYPPSPGPSLPQFSLADDPRVLRQERIDCPGGRSAPAEGRRGGRVTHLRQNAKMQDLTP